MPSWQVLDTMGDVVEELAMFCLVVEYVGDLLTCPS